MRNKIWSAFVVLLALNSCYSFTGASIPSHIHTIAIPLAEDISAFGQSDLRQNLTLTLTTKFIREGSLQVASRSNGDALLTVTVERVTDEATGVRAGETLTNKQVTIFVTAVYFDQKKQKQFWQRDFQQSAVYAISQNLEGLKQALIQAEDKLTDDLLLATISNW
jgi:hypothetical protein